MRSTHYQSAPERTAQILRESTIVCRAITRHQREATLQGRTDEAREMEVLSFVVSSKVITCILPA